MKDYDSQWLFMKAQWGVNERIGTLYEKASDIIPAKPLVRVTYSFWEIHIASAYHLFIQNFKALAPAI